MNLRTYLFGAAICGLTVLPLPSTTPLAFAQEANVAQTKPYLHSLFTDNGVLQRDKSIPVWGWTTPGKKVTVQIGPKSVSASADKDGRWMAKIGPYPAGGPHTLTVTGADPAGPIVRQNILFGDVWICSGQSNMEMGIEMVNDAQQEIAAANYPNIRLYTVPKGTSLSPRDDVGKEWLVCNPTNIKSGAWGGFSATAYFFGRKLNQELKVPIGLIHTSWGGTNAESWVSASALGTIPDFKTELGRVKSAEENQSTPYDQQLETWLAKQNFVGVADGSRANLDDSKWSNIRTPGGWDNSGVAGLRDFDGIAWYRRTIDIPAALAGKDLTFRASVIDDNDVTFWNGVQIGATNGWGDQRSYKIPGAQVKAGRNSIAIKVTDNSGEGGIGGNANDFRLESATGETVPLAGTWKIQTSLTNAQLALAPLKYDPNYPHVSTVLYNAMIAPLEPYGVKGAIWYQGESNASRPEQYTRLLPVLVKDWRARFGAPLPFYIVQLAGFMAPDESPKSDDWPKLRDAQAKTAATVPNTGLVVTYDIGDERDIHPKNKQDVGLRLALATLAKDYGMKVEYSGPTVKSMKADGNRLVLNLDHVGGGLSFKGDVSRLYAVASDDLNWFWATPEIQGNQVVLYSPFVTKPVHVRYAWSNLPQGALYNGANLPAPPFSK
ncbi:9-O-acetylesterase [bacterium]|nr:MAG: 9-O-acetylesterase [bacterium]